MENSLDFTYRLISVFRIIEDAVDNDNIFTGEEFQKIQEYKREMNIQVANS